MKYFGLLKDFKRKTEFKGKISADLVSCNKNSITVSFTKQKTDYKKAVAVAVLDNTNKYLWCSDCCINGNEYTIDFSSFDYSGIEANKTKFKLFLVFENGESLTFSRIYSGDVKKKYSKTKSKKYLYYDVLSEKEKYSEKYNHFTKYVMIANITSNGYFGLITVPKSKLLLYRLSNYIVDFKKEKVCYFVDLKISKYENADISLKMRSFFRDSKNEIITFDYKDYSVEEYEDYYIYKCKLSKSYGENFSGEVLSFISCYRIDNFDYYVTFTIKDNVSEYKKICSEDLSNKKTKPTEIFARIRDNSALEFVTFLPVNYVSQTDYTSIKDYISKLKLLPNNSINSSFKMDNDFEVRMCVDIKYLDEICFFAFLSGTRERVALSHTVKGNSCIIDLSEMKNIMAGDISLREFYLCVAYEFKGKFYSSKLQCIDKNYRGYIPDFKKKAFSFALENETMLSALPVYNEKGFIFIRTGENTMLSKVYVTLPYVSHKLKNNKLTVIADITDTEYDYGEFVLSYRYKKSDDKQQYFVKADIKEKNGRKLLVGTFFLSELNLKRIMWDIYAVFSVNDKKYFAPLKANDKQIYDSFYGRKSHFVINTDEGKDVFFSFFTDKKELAFIVRKKGEMDTTLFRMKEMLSLAIVKVFKSYFQKRKIVLTYEKNCSLAQDNGYVLFKYFMEQSIEKELGAEIYYILDNDSPDFFKLKPYKKNVIDFLSIKHMVYILASKLLVSSDSTAHLYGWRPNSSPVARKIKDKKFVFLQHGVLGLKRVDNVFGTGKSSEVDMFITSSLNEKRIVENQFHYSGEKVRLTGLARWDELVDKSEDRREILLIPTFRIWLDEATDKDFINSDYYKTYKSLLESERLNKILKDNDLTLNFYMHPRFREYTDSFYSKNERIKVIPYGQEPINELMMRCKLLITDYSSVCWDVFYMEKPVLFYQFDYDLYMKIHGSYINMEENLFGERSVTDEELLSSLEKTIENNFQLTPFQKQKRNYSFLYTDNKNCERIVKEIKNLKW